MHTTSLEERETSFHSPLGAAIRAKPAPGTTPSPRALVASLLVLVFTGCGTPPETLRLDVQAYLETLRTWAAIESHTMRSIEHIFATQFVDEAEIRRQIAESTPRIQQHLATVGRYTPRTADVDAIHTTYVRAWDDVLAGYAAILRGFDTGDYANLAKGRALLESWQAEILSIAGRLRDLAERVGPMPDTRPT